MLLLMSDEKQLFFRLNALLHYKCQILQRKYSAPCRSRVPDFRITSSELYRLSYPGNFLLGKREVHYLFEQCLIKGP